MATERPVTVEARCGRATVGPMCSLPERPAPAEFARIYRAAGLLTSLPIFFGCFAKETHQDGLWE